METRRYEADRPGDLRGAPTGDTSRQAPTGDTSRQAPTGGRSRQAPTGDTSRQAPTEGTSPQRTVQSLSEREISRGAPTEGTSRQGGSRVGGWLAAAWLAGACSQAEPPPPAAHDVSADVMGTLTVDGAPAQLARCRPGHAVHVFVEVDTSLGTLRFGDGTLSWRGAELACEKLDRSWGGGVRRDGSAYFRGSLTFRCGTLRGDLTLDCGHISPQEAAELARNRAAAKAQGASGNPPNP